MISQPSGYSIAEFLLSKPFKQVDWVGHDNNSLPPITTPKLTAERGQRQHSKAAS